LSPLPVVVAAQEWRQVVPEVTALPRRPTVVLPLLAVAVGQARQPARAAPEETVLFTVPLEAGAVPH
jgi:hypothetical protein